MKSLTEITDLLTPVVQQQQEQRKPRPDLLEQVAEPEETVPEVPEE